MERVLCQCVSCSTALATFSNLWTQIGKGYYSPVLDDQEDVQFVGQGSKREGEEGTLVAECILQDLACSKCKANIGLKCVSSPVNHVLHTDQVLLRQAAIRMLSPRGRKNKEVELKVQRVLKLKDGPKPASTPKTPAAASVLLGNDESQFSVPFSQSSSTPGIFERMQAELDVQRGEIDRIDTAAFSVVSSVNTSMTRIDMELEKLNDTMNSLRREMDIYKSDVAPLKAGLEDYKASADHHGSVKKLEDQIDLVNESVATVRKLVQDAQTRDDELQSELQTTKKDLRHLQQETAALRQEVTAAKKAAKDGSAASTTSAREIALLKTEMKQLRESFKQQQERLKRPDSTSSAYAAEEVQVLSSSISKLASRTNQFEDFQMQFELFKPRVQRLEGRVNAIEDARESAKDLARDRTDFVPSSLPFETSNPRKRHAPEQEAQSVMETPSKQHAVIGDTVHVASSPMPKPSAQKQSRKETFSSSSVPRLTKQGTVDKRTTKRTRKPSGRKEEDSIYTPPDD